MNGFYGLLVFVERQSARWAFLDGFDDFVGGRAINFYPRFFFGLKNIGIVLDAISGMNAFAGLPYHGHFAVGIFFFQIIGVHNF